MEHGPEISEHGLTTTKTVGEQGPARSPSKGTQASENLVRGA